MVGPWAYGGFEGRHVDRWLSSRAGWSADVLRGRTLSVYGVKPSLTHSKIKNSKNSAFLRISCFAFVYKLQTIKNQSKYPCVRASHLTRTKISQPKQWGHRHLQIERYMGSSLLRAGRREEDYNIHKRKSLFLFIKIHKSISKIVSWIFQIERINVSSNPV